MKCNESPTYNTCYMLYDPDLLENMMDDSSLQYRETWLANSMRLITIFSVMTEIILLD